MSSWSNIVIGDLGEVITGYTPPIKNGVLLVMNIRLLPRLT